MNTRTPEPLDDNERQLARILHALPAGEPSAALDAKILRAAQEAIATPSKKHRWAWGSGWLSLGGLSTAAAAVLTVGVTWQVIKPALMPAPSVSIPAAESVSDDALTVDILSEVKREAAAEQVPEFVADAVAPPPVPAAPPAPVADSVAQSARATPMMEKPLPGPVENIDKAHSELDEHVEATNSRIRRAESEAAQPVQVVTREQIEKSGLGNVADIAPAASAKTGAELESVTVTGSRAKQLEKTRSPESAARDDMRLPPAAWIRKIRSRIANGDVATAKISLQYYAEKYPEEGVPRDLKDLLEEEQP